MKIRFLALLLLVSFGSQINSASAAGPVVSVESAFVRPASVQAEVDAKFQRLQVSGGSWIAGGFKPSYGLLGIDDCKLIDFIVSLATAKDVYFMDFGAGFGAWGCEKASYFKEKYSASDKHFHIFSITGGKEFQTRTTKDGNVTLYNISECKIENVIDELEKRGHFIRNKVSLIVSRWTIVHCVDPFGTLAQLYDLLVPGQGMLLANFFKFRLNSSAEEQSSTNRWHLLSALGADVLYKKDLSPTKGDDFLLRRPDGKSLSVPLKYTGKVFICSSYDMTLSEYEFTTHEAFSLEAGSSFYRETVFFDNNARPNVYYGNEKASALYDELEKEKLFDHSDFYKSYYVK